MTEAVLAKVRLLMEPYDSSNGASLFDFLIAELTRGNWSRFSAAAAFARTTGNATLFIDALEAFGASGNRIELTFGANTFGTEAAGSDFEAIEFLLTRLQNVNASIYLYREKSRTFHPKIYLFDNEEADNALLVVGSSNWTYGGLCDNVEANIIVELNSVHENDVYKRARVCFEDYWQESERVR